MPGWFAYAESAVPQRRPFCIIDSWRAPCCIDIHQPIRIELEQADDSYTAVRLDLLADIRTDCQLGLHQPVYSPVNNYPEGLMSRQNLSSQHCKPCNGKVPALISSQIARLLGDIDPQWQLSESGDALVRRFNFKGFAKAVYLANLCSWLADKEGHHPDIAFGWGYCQVTLTTHDLGGLSENDFIWAARLDALLD